MYRCKEDTLYCGCGLVAIGEHRRMEIVAGQDGCQNVRHCSKVTEAMVESGLSREEIAAKRCSIGPKVA